MERKMYEPTEKQLVWWNNDYTPSSVPSDDEFKAQWKRSHHGKVTGWGMAKRDWALAQLKNDPAYQRGIWQGRVDAARGLEYSEERNENAYNLGYHRGYTNYQSDRRGWDQATRDAFEAKYC